MNILIIDDEPKAREYMRSGLTESGYVVDVAVNGREGLFMAEEYHYDLILLDVMMPELNGWEVMKTLDCLLDTPVIFLTAKSTVDDRIKGLELGADDYLVKPFSFAELLGPHSYRAAAGHERKTRRASLGGRPAAGYCQTARGAGRPANRFDQQGI